MILKAKAYAMDSTLCLTQDMFQQAQGCVVTHAGTCIVVMRTPNGRQTERAGEETDRAGKDFIDFFWAAHRPSDVAAHGDLAQYARWPAHQWSKISRKNLK